MVESLEIIVSPHVMAGIVPLNKSIGHWAAIRVPFNTRFLDLSRNNQKPDLDLKYS